MANDCALFIIQLPNDFIDENSFTPKPSNGVKSLILAVSIHLNVFYSMFCELSF